MMAAVRVFLLLWSILSCYVPGLLAADCDNPGLLVDIHSREVHGRANLFRYGLSIGLGTPSQNDSLWPAINHNETAFSATDYCGSSSPQSCPDGARGFFAAQDSPTWRNVSSLQVLDSPPMFSKASRLNGEDTLNIWQTTTYGGPQTLVPVDQFPVMLLSNYTTTFPYINPSFGPGSTLGLGSTSTVLTQLFDRGLIAARSYGLYLGPTLGRLGDNRSGSLVLGGYDAGRFRGPVALFDQVPALPENMLSPFRITVSQVSLVTSGGETVADLVDDSFDAYLSTDRSPLQFPPKVTTKLANYLRATAANNDDNTLRLPATFDGNLTITLSNNLTFTFDSSWMTDSQLNTPISVAPLTGSDLGVNAVDETPVIFGASFLLRAYLFVNHDANPPSFGLAQALPTVTQIEQRPYCANDLPIAAETVNMPSKGSSRKALIGGICGGLIGGPIIITMLWFLSRRKNASSKNSRNSTFNSEKDGANRLPMVAKFQLWASKARRHWGFENMGNTRHYTYKDIESGSRTKPHVSAFMFTSLDMDKDFPQRTFPETTYEGHRTLSPAAIAGHRRQGTETSLTHVVQGIWSVSPPTSTKTAGSQIAARASLGILPSAMAMAKAPTPLSAYNRHQRSETFPHHQRNGSRDVDALKSSEQQPFLTSNRKGSIETVQEKFEVDKSLPATPAPSTPGSPASLILRSSPYGDLEAAVPAVPRIPSMMLMGAASQSLPSPLGVLSGDNNRQLQTHTVPRKDVPQGRTSITQQSRISVDLTSPTSVSTTYSFWRGKRSRSTVTTSSADGAKSKMGFFSTHGKSKNATNPSAVEKAQVSQRPQLRHRRSSTRSRVAMAARLSRLKELQHSGVREIIIRKKARSKPHSRNEGGVGSVSIDKQTTSPPLQPAPPMPPMTSGVKKRDLNTVSKQPEIRIAAFPSGISSYPSIGDLNHRSHLHPEQAHTRYSAISLSPSSSSSSLSNSHHHDHHDDQQHTYRNRNRDEPRAISPVSAISDANTMERYMMSMATTAVTRSPTPPLPPVPDEFLAFHKTYRSNTATANVAHR